MIYQEQTLQIFRELGGFTPLEAENARKIIKLVAVPNPSKDALKKFDKIVEKFQKGCEKRGISKRVQQVVLDAIKESSNYSFNKCLHELTRVTVLSPSGEGVDAFIKDVKVGDFVLAYDLTARIPVWARVKTVYTSKADLYTFTTSQNHQIGCSMKHKVLNSCEYKMKPIGEIFAQCDPRIAVVDKTNSYEMSNDVLESMTLLGSSLTAYDIEIDHPDHVFIANDHFLVSNSHSVSYAMLAAETMFYKIYYPLQFYLAVLQHCQDDEEERKLAVKKLRELGYTLTLGTIDDCTIDFQADTDKRVLYIPISLLRNLRKESARALLQQRPFESLEDFFAKAKKYSDKRTVEVLICAGLLNKWERTKVLELFKTTYKIKENAQHDMMKATQEDLLGFSLLDRSDKLRNLFKTLRRNSKLDIVDLQTISNESQAIMLTGFMIEDIQQKKSKKNGKKYHLLKVTDGSYDTVCFVFNEEIDFQKREVLLAECRSSDYGLQLLGVKARVLLP